MGIRIGLGGSEALTQVGGERFDAGRASLERRRKTTKQHESARPLPSHKRSAFSHPSGIRVWEAGLAQNLGTVGHNRRRHGRLQGLLLGTSRLIEAMPSQSRRCPQKPPLDRARTTQHTDLHLRVICRGPAWRGSRSRRTTPRGAMLRSRTWPTRCRRGVSMHSQQDLAPQTRGIGSCEHMA